MNSPFAAMLREFAERLASEPKVPAEAVAARRLALHLNELAACFEGQTSGPDAVSIVCHDLKDPLASIAMGAGFLKKAPDLSDARRRVLDAMARSADRMNRIVMDLYELARVESGRVVLDRSPNELGPILRDAVKSLAAAAEEQGVSLEMDVPAEPMQVTCDAPRVERIVACLARPAILATPKGGRVVVSARMQRDGARVTVTDTGTPIPAARLPEAFEQVANSKRVREGVGFELAIARALVELHGGTIGVTSRAGDDQGPSETMFAFTLPRHGL
jgi:signal transduction histidine kinase